MKLVHQHEALVQDIDRCRLSKGQVCLWWLGQHGFVVKVGETIVYIDPFLRAMSERLVAPLLEASEIRHAAAIAGTHDHIDHIDREVWPALAEASGRTRFVVPQMLRERLAEALKIPQERMVGLDDGTWVEIGEVRISAIPAAHEFLDRDMQTGHYPYLGYMIQSDGPTIYHAGDTCLYEGMYAKIRRFDPEVMLLPINGRDAQRLSGNIFGNMTYQEAADLAGALKAKWVVPTHWDMFEGNLADPQAFVRYVSVKYPQTRAHVMNYGQGWIVSKEA